MIFDFPAQREHLHFFVTQRLFQFSSQTKHIAQLTLHRQRAFGSLLASCNGHIVEALAGVREEKRIWIFQSQFFGERRIRHQVSIAQFGENDLQRPSKTI